MAKIELTKEECCCSLVSFYETVAKKMGVVVTDNTHFDCKKICITKAVQDELWNYYLGNLEEEKDFDTSQITMFFLIYGPKANLEPIYLYLAETEDGFIS